jgi:hypothetical protein
LRVLKTFERVKRRLRDEDGLHAAQPPVIDNKSATYSGSRSYRGSLAIPSNAISESAS